MPEQSGMVSGGVSLSLAGIKLLRSLTDAERATLETRCAFRRFAAGETVLDRYGAGTAVYFMVSGVARVVHFIAEHDEISIATVAAGDTIGEIAAIDGHGRSATIIADEDCVVAELPNEEFRALVIRKGEVALALLSRWAAVIRMLDDKISYLATGNPDQRVYSELIRLARQEKPDSERWLIRELPSHQELALWAQTTREAVATAVAELVRRGVVERRSKTLYINDYKTLKSMIWTAVRVLEPGAKAGSG